MSDKSLLNDCWTFADWRDFFGMNFDLHLDVSLDNIPRNRVILGKLVYAI